MKQAFFDMDGTLIAPMFQHNGTLRYTFPLDQWRTFCNTEQHRAYNHCRVIQPTIQFANELMPEYALSILSTVNSPGERLAKRHFLCTHNGMNIFRHVYFVDHDDEKFHVIKSVMELNDLRPDDIILVEDNFYAVMKANELGYKGVHISHVIDHIMNKQA